jgi:pimeloyl-ACP methyl ester carboxylesterase
VWRYQRPRLAEGADIGEMPDFATLWDDVSKLTVPLMLVRGGDSGVVGDEDVAALRGRQPDVRIETVEGAGHSIQGDRPVELARLLADFLER